MSQALKRIEKELKVFNEDEHDEKFTAGPVDESDMFVWEGTIPGPEDSPYEGGVFKLSIKFPKDYPYKPPEVLFLTKIYHPNVKRDTGSICLDLLKDQWAPNTTIMQIYNAIQNLLSIPNCDHPLEKEIAKECNENNEQYKKTAKEWTEKYAQEE